MAFLKRLLLAIVALAVLMLAAGFLLPQEVAVARSTTINATPDRIFPYLNDFRKFQEWSPWAKIDPEGTKLTYDGPEAGVGHKVSWASEDDKVGTGTQEIVESVENQSVKTTLNFGDQGMGAAVFNLKPVADGTEITWGFSADMGMNPVGRWMGLMIGPMVGEQYDIGLANLKTLVEALPSPAEPASQP